jgi:tetratricopeptide (TPR) repeat protein
MKLEKPALKNRSILNSEKFRHAPMLVLLLWLVGCAVPEPKPEERYAAAKALFDRTTKSFHLPSAEAKASQKSQLLHQAAAGYEQLLDQYRDQSSWCAQAMRSLANVRAMQCRLDDAICLYARVEKEYPREDWEIVQAWKSAADLLWDAGRRNQAKEFYRKIVERFEAADSLTVVKSIVRGAKSRLAENESIKK